MSADKPIWKKEISLKRKPKAAKAPKSKRAKPEVELTAPSVKEVPWWKKEITLSRKPQSAPAPAAPERFFEGPLEPAPAAQPEPLTSYDPPVEAEHHVEPELAFEPEPVPSVLPPLPGDAEVVYSASVLSEPDWGFEDAPADEPTLAADTEPELEFEQESPTATVVPEPQGSVPWWKKEISLGSKRAPKPVAAKLRRPGLKKPVLKKKVSFSLPKPSARKPKLAVPKLAAPKLSKPNLRREIKLPNPKISALSLPKFSLHGRGGGHSRAKEGEKLKKVVGLKIGASQLAAASVENNGHAELVQVVREPLDPGVVVSGELRDPEALAASLRGFFARHKLPKKNIRLGIASNRIGVRIFDLVGIEDDKALANAIQFRAQDALPIPLDEAVLDYHVLGESVDEEGRPTRRVLLVVAYRELVERYVAACREAGLNLVGVDLEAFALLRALGAPRDESEHANAATVAVALGHERSTFAVTDGRICEFTRVLEWGGSALNIAIARALDRAPHEVEAFKRDLSLDEGGPAPEGLTAAEAEAAVTAMRTQVQSFARELVSSLQFYQHQPGSLGIGEIVLTGGTAHLSGLAAELQKLIGVPVRVGDPLARVRIAKKVSSAEQVGSLAVAIGLGIED